MKVPNVDHTCCRNCGRKHKLEVFGVATDMFLSQESSVDVCKYCVIIPTASQKCFFLQVAVPFFIDHMENKPLSRDGIMNELIHMTLDEKYNAIHHWWTKDLNEAGVY